MASVPSIPASDCGVRMRKLPDTELMKRINPPTSVTSTSAPCGITTVELDRMLITESLASKRMSAPAASRVVNSSPGQSAVPGVGRLTAPARLSDTSPSIEITKAGDTAPPAHTACASADPDAVSPMIASNAPTNPNCFDVPICVPSPNLVNALQFCSWICSHTSEMQQENDSISQSRS